VQLGTEVALTPIVSDRK